MGPSMLGKRVKTNPAATRAGLCTNYVSFARSVLTAGRAISEKSWQANIIMTKKKQSLPSFFLIENDRIIPTNET